MMQADKMAKILLHGMLHVTIYEATKLFGGGGGSFFHKVCIFIIFQCFFFINLYFLLMRLLALILFNSSVKW